MRRPILGLLLLGVCGCNGGGKDHGGRATTTAPVVSTSTVLTPPAAPTRLAARVANVRVVELTWTDASSNEDGFVVDRRAGGATVTSFAEVGRVAIGVTRHTDLAPDLATAYDYRVRAFNAAGSNASNIATATTGGGALVDAGAVYGPLPPYGVALGDLDGDGDVDVAVACEGGVSGPDRVFLNDGRGALTDSGQLLANPSSRAVAAGDLDGDLDLDLVFANNGAGERVWLNIGQGQLRDTGQDLGPGTISRAVALADVDTDGDSDMIVGRHYVPDMIYMNDGTGRFTAGATLSANATNSLVVGDLNGDARVDVVSCGPSGVEVWLNAGAGAFARGPALVVAGYLLSLALGDLDRDGDLDLLVGALNAPGLVLLGDGLGGFQSTGQALGSTRSTNSITAADMDGDGDLDVVTGKSDGFPTPSAILFRNDGRAVFGAGSQAPPVPLYVRHHQVADMDRDGDLDVVTGSIINGTVFGVRVHLNR